MNENKYQKLAELIDRAPRLLGPGGLFGGLNQEHGLMVDFVKFVRGLKIGNNISPETVNIRSFVAYLSERKNAEEVGRKLYDMRQNGEIVDDPHVKTKNTLLNLAETLIDLGVGEKPENVGGDYEGVLRETLTRAAARTPKAAERRLHGEEKGEAKQKAAASAPESATPQGTAPAPHGATLQDTTSEPGRDVTSPEKPLSTMGEYLTDQASIVKKEEAQAGTLAISRAGVSRSEAEASGEEIGETKQGDTAPAPEGTTPKEPEHASDSDIASPETQLPTMPDIASGEGGLQPESEEISGDTSFRDSGLLRPLTAPIIGEAAGQATGESLTGTKSAPGAERRHIAQLPGGGRMLRKGPKKQGQRQEQGRGTGESGLDQGRQTGPGRNPAQDFANSQAAQPQKSRVGRRVAGGAGIAGSLALMKGMYGGAAANAASFGILQTILDLLT